MTRKIDGLSPEDWKARYLRSAVNAKGELRDFYRCSIDEDQEFDVPAGQLENDPESFRAKVNRRKKLEGTLTDQAFDARLAETQKRIVEDARAAREKSKAQLNARRQANAASRLAQARAHEEMKQAAAETARLLVLRCEKHQAELDAADLLRYQIDETKADNAAVYARLGIDVGNASPTSPLSPTGTPRTDSPAPPPSPIVAEVLARAGRSPKGREAQERAERGAVDQIAQQARTQMGGAQTPRAASPDDLQGQAAEDGAAAPSPERSSSELALNQQINAKQGQQIETQNRLLDENAEENAQLQQHIASRDAMIAQLQRQAASRDTMVAALQSKLSTFISDATTDKKTMERLREERHQVTVERDEALSELRRRRQANGPPSPAVKTGPVPKRTSLKELR